MAEYIDREKALEEFEEWVECTGYLPKGTSYYYECRGCIEDVPAADVVEVKHGYNATHNHPVDEFVCSECGFTCIEYVETKHDEDGEYSYYCECEFKYCPNCGAKMGGENNV